MNTIKVKTQEEFDSLPDSFSEETEIKIIGEIGEISATIENTFFSVHENGIVRYIYGNGTVESVYGNGTVRYIFGNGIVKHVFGNGTVNHVFGNGMIEHVSENGIVEYASGNGRVRYIFGNGIVISVFGNGTVNHVFGNGMIEHVSGNGIVEYASGNSVVHLFSPTAKVLKADQQATIIYQRYEGTPTECADTVNIVHLQKTGLTLQDFIKIYRVETSNGELLLYKFVQTDFTDFYSGKVKYEIGTTVEYPDWNNDINIECGGGLHLSSSVASCRRFGYSNSGHVLKCKVNPTNILVHPEPEYPQKVRCRKVKVLEEVL